jgi:hypothetical protein
MVIRPTRIGLENVALVALDGAPLRLFTDHLRKRIPLFIRSRNAAAEATS